MIPLRETASPGGCRQKVEFQYSRASCAYAGSEAGAGSDADASSDADAATPLLLLRLTPPPPPPPPPLLVFPPPPPLLARAATSRVKKVHTRSSAPLHSRASSLRSATTSRGPWFTPKAPAMRVCRGWRAAQGMPPESRVRWMREGCGTEEY